MRLRENDMILFALLFVSLHCADEKMRDQASTLAKKIKARKAGE